MRIEVTGLKEVELALNEAVADIGGASEEMLTVMLMAISANTLPYVPVDTAALINSETRGVRTEGSNPVGHIEYGGHGVNARGTPVQDYAIYVHEGPQKNWQKPGASNKFLERGAQDFIRDDLSAIISRYQP